ncbi:siderophore-interacting protein [Trinickia fusca]|uniref:Siderophore-interacting protein n=1 Tax=Trinickia fusca TaxID=2419777 RepID=A0A494X6P9_9BURK|nr:siderophore-interacting protein [Trinickia fusca]RKP43433.1 siderophore-interacting protein [Trinickia fusca]
MFFFTKQKSKTPPPLAVEVVHIHDLTPHMRRISVTGEGLAAMKAVLPAQWVKMYVPLMSGGSAGRAYTISALDRGAHRMDIDIALHGDAGPATTWARRVKPGERIEIAGPRGGYEVDPTTQHYTLIGDVTALPAIASILRHLPESADVQAIVEVADVREEQTLRSPARLAMRWLYAGRAQPGTTGQMEALVRDVNIDALGHRVWIAGEASMVRNVRNHLLFERGLPREAVNATSYWKLGTADHREKH